MLGLVSVKMFTYWINVSIYSYTNLIQEETMNNRDYFSCDMGFYNNNNNDTILVSMTGFMHRK